MFRYQCHKTVDAKPMSRGQYNVYRGCKIPDNENPKDEGFLVVYNQGTEDHYESWSPKKIFEEGYTRIHK